MESCKILVILCVMADSRQSPITASREDDEWRVAESDKGYIKTLSADEILNKEFPSQSVDDGRSVDQIIAAAEIATENGGGVTGARMASPNDFRLEIERLAGTGMRKESLRWPKGIIPFKIESGYTKKELDIIYAGMQMWMRKTCIRFVEAGSPEAKSTGHNHFILIVDGPGCFTVAGYRYHPRLRYQIVSLSRPDRLDPEGCITPSIVAHELGHVIGLVHEQMREDRDQYIRVVYENIPDNKHVQYEEMVGQSEFGTPYDYCSIMHYSPVRLGRFVLVPKDLGYISVIGRANNLSYIDATIVNTMYKCGIAVDRTPCLRKPCTDSYSAQDCKTLELQNQIFFAPASNVTAEGWRCTQGYSCGKHNGYKYFWCWTGTWSGSYAWDYCCAPGKSCEKRAGAGAGEDHEWCWADYYEKEWSKCKKSTSKS